MWSSEMETSIIETGYEYFVKTIDRGYSRYISDQQNSQIWRPSNGQRFVAIIFMHQDCSLLVLLYGLRWPTPSAEELWVARVIIYFIHDSTDNCVALWYLQHGAFQQIRCDEIFIKSSLMRFVWILYTVKNEFSITRLFMKIFENGGFILIEYDKQ